MTDNPLPAAKFGAHISHPARVQAAWPAAVEAELGLRFPGPGTWPEDAAAKADDLPRGRHRPSRLSAPGPDQRVAARRRRGRGEWLDSGPAQGAGCPPGAVKWLWRLLVAAIVVLAAFSAANPGPGDRRAAASGGGDPGGGDPAGAAGAAVRGVAARWVAGQVGRGAIVACDPAMCATLQSRGLASGNLVMLRQGAPDPLGSDVVVATAAVRNQFGSRLSGVYAPAVMASFGSGSARIQIRAVAPDGAAAYRSALGADLLARKAAGAQLLLNPRIGVSPVARRQLTSGEPDSRLLITLAAMATMRPVYIAAFGGSAHGAGVSMPLRSAIIRGIRGAGYVRQAVAFLRAQRAPYLAASVQATTLADGRPIIRIEFAAPSPLGLLGAGYVAAKRR